LLLPFHWLLIAKVGAENHALHFQRKTRPV